MQAINRESVISLAYIVFDYLGKAKKGRDRETGRQADRQTETSEENRKEKKVFGGARLLI